MDFIWQPHYAKYHIEPDERYAKQKYILNLGS